MPLKKYLNYTLLLLITTFVIATCSFIPQNQAQTMNTDIDQAISRLAETGNLSAQTGLADMLLYTAKARLSQQPKIAEQLYTEAEKIITEKMNLGDPAYYQFTALDQNEQEIAFFALATPKIAYLFIGENLDKNQPQTLSLDSLHYPEAHQSFLQPAFTSRALWAASFTPESREQLTETFINNEDAQLAGIRVDEQGNQKTLHMKWTDIPVEGAKTTVNVTVQLQLQRGSEKSNWYIDVLPKYNQQGTQKFLYNVEFPIIPNLTKNLSLAKDDTPDYLVYPVHSGELFINPSQSLDKPQKMLYPGEARWQSLVYYHHNHGINYMVTDAEGYVKTAVAKKTGRDSIQLSWLHHPQGMGYKGSRFRMMGDNPSVNYTCQISTFDGDWYEAAQIYRDWMLQQNFLGNGKPKRLAENPQAADWAKNMIVSYRTYSGLGLDDTEGGIGDQKNEVRQIYDFHRQNLGEYAGQVSIYAWRDLPPDKGSFFDRPEVAPGENNYIGPYFGQAIAKLKEANLHGNPFVESPLWDRDGTTYGPEKGRQIALLQYKGAPIRVKFGKGKKETVLGWVDVGEDRWLTKQSEIVQTLLDQAETEEAKIDGVYYDLALITNHLNHRSPKTVGGNYSSLAWQKLLQTVTEKARRGSGRQSNPEYTLFTEGMADCYLNLNHFYLHFQKQIPFDLVLWGDYVKTYGAKSYWPLTDDSRDNDWQQATPLALTLAWGQPIGRIDTDLIQADPAVKDFLVDMAAYRQANLDYLSSGRMLKPVSLESIDWSSQPTPSVPPNQLLDVMIPNGVFAHGSETNRSVLFVFVNGTLHNSTAEVQFTIDPSQYNIPRNYKLYRRELSKGTTLEVKDHQESGFESGPITQTIQLKPLQIVTYVAKP